MRTPGKGITKVWGVRSPLLVYYRTELIIKSPWFCPESCISTWPGFSSSEIMPMGGVPQRLLSPVLNASDFYLRSNSSRK